MTPDTAWAGGALRQKLRRTCAILLVIAALSLAAGLTAGRKTLQGDRAQRAIPIALPPDKPVWRGRDDPLPQRILDILRTNDCLNREYHREDLAMPVYLTIVYSESNRKGVHPPKVCLQGAGDLALKETPVTLPGLGPGGGDLEALEMITERRGLLTYHLYFYKCGNVCTASFVKQQLVIWLNGLTSRDASGALIRLSAMVPRDQDRERAIDMTRRATRELLALIMPYVHQGL